MLGKGGNDAVKGKVDDDKIFGGPGDDLVKGGTGRDRAKGGDDIVRGGTHSVTDDGAVITGCEVKHPSRYRARRGRGPSTQKEGLARGGWGEQASPHQLYTPM